MLGEGEQCYYSIPFLALFRAFRIQLRTDPHYGIRIQMNPRLRVGGSKTLILCAYRLL